MIIIIFVAVMQNIAVELRVLNYIGFILCCMCCMHSSVSCIIVAPMPSQSQALKLVLVLLTLLAMELRVSTAL